MDSDVKQVLETELKARLRNGVLVLLISAAVLSYILVDNARLPAEFEYQTKTPDCRIANTAFTSRAISNLAASPVTGLRVPQRENRSLTLSINGIPYGKSTVNIHPQETVPPAGGVKSKVKQLSVKTFRSSACSDPFLPVFLSEKRFICFSAPGRLGNQMFAFASAYGIARHLNRSLVVMEDWPLLKYFKINVTVVSVCVCQHAKPIVPKLQCSFDENLFNLSEGTNHRVVSFLQSWKYFWDVSTEIRHQFTFQEKITRKAFKIIEKIKVQYKEKLFISKNEINLTLVGIHNRRGDMVSHKDFNVAPKDYLIKAMDYFRNTLTHVAFLVCTDDMLETKSHLEGQADVWYIEGNPPEVDMCVLANCHNVIMTVGSFGWFSAFLAGRQATYYKHPITELSHIRKQFSSDYSDYFYPGWIGMGG